MAIHYIIVILICNRMHVRFHYPLQLKIVQSLRMYNFYKTVAICTSCSLEGMGSALLIPTVVVRVGIEVGVRARLGSELKLGFGIGFTVRLWVRVGYQVVVRTRVQVRVALFFKTKTKKKKLLNVIFI